MSWLAFVAGALFGLADSLNNTTAFAIVGDHFSEAPLDVDAYAAYQFLQAAGMTFGYGLPLFFATDWAHRWTIFGVQFFTLLCSALGVLSLPSVEPALPEAWRHAASSKNTLD